MNVIYHLGLDVHKETIAVSFARELPGFVWALTREENEPLMEAMAAVS